MQDVAAEAGMSPGNLYRYFPSKDALVAGLCERDRVGLVNEFAEVREAGGDFLTAFRELGRRHFDDSAFNQSKAKLCMEIWAEAARNPAIAALQTEFDRSFEEQLIAIFESAKQAGAIHPEVDVRGVASIISKLGDGLFVRRALAADFDSEREVAEVFAVIGALLKGAINVSCSVPPRRPRHDVQPHSCSGPDRRRDALDRVRRIRSHRSSHRGRDGGCRPGARLLSSTSSGLPSTLKTWPLVTSPTGTEIDEPVSVTGAPRTSPSVGCIAIARTWLSPRC